MGILRFFDREGDGPNSAGPIEPPASPGDPAPAESYAAGPSLEERVSPVASKACDSMLPEHPSAEVANPAAPTAARVAEASGGMEQVLDASDFALPQAAAECVPDTGEESIGAADVSLPPGGSSPMLFEQRIEEPDTLLLQRAPEAQSSAPLLATDEATTETQPISLPGAPSVVDDTRIEEMMGSLGALDAKLDEIAKYNDWGRLSLVKLQDEIDGYRNDFLTSAQQPLLRRVCSLVTSMEKVAHGASISAADIDFLMDQVLDLLADQGVEPLEDPVGETFTGSRHRGVRAVVTADESEAGKIAELVARGWTMNGKVMTTQNVAVFKYEAPIVPETRAEASAPEAWVDVSAEPPAPEAGGESAGSVQGQGGTDE